MLEFTYYRLYIPDQKQSTITCYRTSRIQLIKDLNTWNASSPLWKFWMEHNEHGVPVNESRAICEEHRRSYGPSNT